MGPIAESVFMPSMTDGWMADRLGGWFGTGPARGLALMFVLAGLIGIVVSLVALASRSYRLLSAQSFEPAESEEAVCTEVPTERAESVAVAVEAVEEAERVPCEPGVARVPIAACVGH